MIKIISPSKLYVNGPPKLAIHSKNQNIDKLGKKFKFLLFIIIIREWVRSYIILAQENIPDEQTPWAIIIIIVPFIDHSLFIKILTIIKAIWTTDE